MVHFLDSYLCHPCEAARYLALDLLCGSVPRLGDKTDGLLRPLVPTLLKMMEDDTPKEVAMKAFHFLRAYSRATQDIESFLLDFCHMGFESTSEETKLSCIHGMCIVFDQDIGDKLYSILIPSLASLLNRNGCPKVLRSTYRSLRRIHDLIEDDRFLKLMDPDTTDLYMCFLTFDENDPYLNSDLLDLQKLITEYKNKMARIHLRKAFGIVDPSFLTPIAATGDSQREFSVNNLALALKRLSWSESDVESHVLDLIKLVAAFLADDSNRPSQMSGLDILKELISRMRFHVGQHLTNVVEILRETLASSSVELASKTKKVVHRLMKMVHPMSVIWEMLRDWEPRHKESILGFICGELKCFPYCDFDLVSLCATVGQDMEDCNPRVRQECRKCVAQLLNVMQTSPVPIMRKHAIHILLRNQSLKRETLKCVGISEVDCGEFRADSYSYFEDSASSSTAPSTAISSASTLVSELSAIHSHLTDKFQFRKGTISNTTPSSIKKFSKSKWKLPDKHIIQSSSDTQNSTLSCCQNKEDIILSPTLSSSNAVSNSKPDSCMKLLDKDISQSVTNSKGNSCSRTSMEQRDHMSDKREVIQSNVSHASKNASSRTGSSSRMNKSSRFDPKTSSVPIEVPNFTKIVKDEVSHPNSILTKDTRDTFLLTNLEHGEPVSMCSFIYSDQVSGKQNSPAVIPEDCSLIGHPKDTSTPRFRRKLKKECDFPGPERKCSLSGGDTSQAMRMNESRLESWIHRYSQGIPVAEYSGNEDKCATIKSDIHEEPLVDGNCTLVSISSVHTEQVDDKFDSSLGFQIQCLDPKKYNFNIMRVTTPKTTESVQELDEDESIGNESLAEASPTVITTPGESDGCSVSRNSNHLKRTRSRNCTQKKHLPQTKNKGVDPQRKDILKDTVAQVKVKSNNNNIKCARNNSQPIRKKIAQVSKPRHGNPLSDKRKTKIFPQDKSLNSLETKVKTRPKAMDSPSSEKYSFNPVYYKLTNTSTEIEMPGDIPDEKTASAGEQDEEDVEEAPSVCTIVDISISKKDGSQKNITDAINKTTKSPSLEIFIKRPIDKEKNDGRALQMQSASKGMSSSSVETPPWYKGRDIPRTPVAILERNVIKKEVKTLKYANRRQEDRTKKAVDPDKKRKIGVKKDRITCIPKDSVDEEEEVKVEGSPKDDVEQEDSPPNPLPEGLFDKCPWRRDLEYAHKGGTCPWALSFEESFRQMAPLPSEEAAEAEIKKALEHLDGNSWKCKEEALEALLRVAVHHQEVASGEIARVVVALCREVRDFRKSVAGKAVITLGLLYSTMGKRMENKLRVVVGSLITKSGNRTLAAYFRLVIQSLLRIVSSSPPQKVALAFIHEGSRHPNKASRETAAQFLALLTETMGSGNSLSGPMTSPMLKCAAHFVFDCSPLTRYCGKRMFQVFQKHPQFQKMKDHHLDVGTSNNLSKVLEHIGSKGVIEEFLPINIIKEKMKDYSPNLENAFI